MPDASTSHYPIVYSLQNLASSDTRIIFPAEVAPTLPDYEGTGVGRKRLWSTPEFEGHFIAYMKGLNSGVRVNQRENPPVEFTGVIIDIDDCPSDLNEFLSEVSRLEFRHQPTYVCRTARDNYRLIYEFNVTLPYINQKIYALFVKKLISICKVDTLPGRVDPASWHPYQYFEIGRDWHICNPGGLSPNVMNSAHLQVVRSIKSSRDLGKSRTVDIQTVRRELARKYPDCGMDWDQFSYGDYCPRFWDPTADNPKGARVYPAGIYPFTRPEEGLIRWGDERLVGELARDEALDRQLLDAITDIHYDGKHYWRPVQGDSGVKWKAIDGNGVKRLLKGRGLSGVKDEGEVMSAVEMALHELEMREIDGVGVIPYHPMGLVNTPGGTILNTQEIQIMKPAKGKREWGEKFPFLAEYFEKVFPPMGLHLFKCWLKHACVPVWEGETMRRGLGVELVGPTGIGKGFLTQGVLAQIFGGKGAATADPTSWLTADTPYNSTIVSKPLLVMGDVPAVPSVRQHQLFSQRVKKLLADETVECNEKFMKRFEVLWSGRLVITCNGDTRSLEALPSTGGLKDKLGRIHLREFRFSEYPSDPEVAKELPHFLAYIREYEIPEEDQNPRFGVRPFHIIETSPNVEEDCYGEATEEEDYEAEMDDIMHRLIIFHCRSANTNFFTASDLLESSEIAGEGLRSSVKRNFYNTRRIGAVLRRITRYDGIKLLSPKTSGGGSRARKGYGLAVSVDEYEREVSF